MNFKNTQKKEKKKHRLKMEDMNHLYDLLSGNLNIQKNQELQLKLELQNKARENYVIREATHNLALNYDYNPFYLADSTKGKSLFKALHDLSFSIKPEIESKQADFQGMVNSYDFLHKRIKNQQSITPLFKKAVKKIYDDSETEIRTQVTEQHGFFDVLKSLPYQTSSTRDLKDMIYELEDKRGKMNLDSRLYPPRKTYNYGIIKQSTEESSNKYSAAVIPHREISNVNRQLIVGMDEYRPPKGFNTNLHFEEIKGMPFELCLSFASCRVSKDSLNMLFVRKEQDEAKKDVEAADIKIIMNKEEEYMINIDIQTDDIDLMSFKEDELNINREQNFTQAERQLAREVQKMKEKSKSIIQQKLALIYDKKIIDRRVHQSQTDAQKNHLEQIVRLLAKDNQYKDSEQTRIKQHIKNANRLKKGRDASDIIKLQLLLDYVIRHKHSINELQKLINHPTWK